MPGFCPLDAQYLERPSMILGGWIGWVITDFESGRAALNLVPGESKYVSATVHEFDSLGSAVARLVSEHIDGKYVYRGQTQRYRYRVEGIVNQLGQGLGIEGPLHLDLESLLPSFARRLCESGSSPLIDWSSWLPISKLDPAAAAVRAVTASRDERLLSLVANACKDAFSQSALGSLQSVLAGMSMFDDINALVSGQAQDPRLAANIPGSLAKLISLAQHYGYPTCMVDITTSPRVASWFASHQWSGELYAPHGNGVIYRFAPGKLVDLIAGKMFDGRADSAQMTELGVFGHVDLFGLDVDLCPRVRAQAGGSLFGLESVVVSLLAFGFGAVELFTFPHEKTSGSESTLEVADIRPEDDALVKIFDDDHREANSILSWSELEPLLKRAGVDRNQLSIYENHWTHYMARVIAAM